MKTKIIQITAGRGPAKCCWVVAKVLKIFLEDCTKHKIKTILLSKESGLENRTLQSATIQIEGHTIDAFLKPWIGTIQWIGISSYRPQHKRKNWFIGLYEIEHNPTFEIDDKAIVFQASKSSGPGGQHVNKVSSAIRATHIPTNTQVLVMDSRSQHQNKKLAKQRLQEKVAKLQLQALQKQVKDQWENHSKLERGHPIKVCKGGDFKVQKKDKTYKTKRNQLKTELRKQLK